MRTLSYHKPRKVKRTSKDKNMQMLILDRGVNHHYAALIDFTTSFDSSTLTWFSVLSPGIHSSITTRSREKVLIIILEVKGTRAV
ncbi:hypothetical protein SLA2020_008390 [Shorea laevis]